jgi:hypothetical protein
MHIPKAHPTVRLKCAQVLFGILISISSAHCQLTAGAITVMVADTGCQLRLLNLATKAVSAISPGPIVTAYTAQGFCYIAPLANGKEIYVANQQTIWKYTVSTQTVSTVAGKNALGSTYPPVFGAASNARFGPIVSMKLAPDQTYLLIAEDFGLRRLLLGTMTVETISAETYTGYREGTGSNLQVWSCTAMDMDPTGTFALFSDMQSFKIRRLHLNESPIRSSFVAGSSQGQSNGIGSAARVSTISAISITSDGLVAYFLQDVFGSFTMGKLIISTR